MTIYLVPVGGRRFELYSEGHDGIGDPTAPGRGRFHRFFHRSRHRWHQAVEEECAREAKPSGPWARLRGAAVRWAAEAVNEQRTLWALGHAAAAALAYPADLDDREARAVLDDTLRRSLRHHGLWLVIDGLVFALSAALAPLPGPNLAAYYFGFRVVGHYLSWRGARQARNRTQWTTRPEPGLAELAALAELPRHQRIARVEAIAGELKLARLAAFFDRAVVPVG
jgi:hypothetical protein